MVTTIEDRIKAHLPGRYRDTLKCYDVFEHQDWVEYSDEGELIGFVSYFLVDFKHDIIITAAKDNKFSKAHWRILRDTLKGRVKPIRIQSDPSNIALHKGAARFGGVFVEDEIFFNELYEE